MDDFADGVQPDDGQGAEGSPASPYQEWLDRIPEEAREHVEPVFRDWDSNVTRRFQEAAEFRKSWEPYEELGVKQRTPEEVQWDLQIAQAARDNPQALREWLDQTYGPSTPQQQAETLEAYVDPTIQQLEQILTSKLSPLEQRLQAFSQWQEQQEFAQRRAEADRFVEGQMKELEQKHPTEFNRQAIEKLVVQYIQNDPRNAVPRAFADWQAIRGQIEKDTLQGKLNQPKPAEGGGMVNAAVDAPKTLAEAGAAALEQIRQANRS